MPSEIKPVSPEEAAKLIAEGVVYLDVRSEPEFEQGRVPGALNVPLMHQTPAGLKDNPEFLEVVQVAFARTEALVIGCRSGGRSRRAALMLAKAGFVALYDQVAGFEGGRDPFGRVLPGWSKKGLPVEQGAAAGRTYADVKQRRPADE